MHCSYLSLCPHCALGTGSVVFVIALVPSARYADGPGVAVRSSSRRPHTLPSVHVVMLGVSPLGPPLLGWVSALLFVLVVVVGSLQLGALLLLDDPDGHLRMVTFVLRRPGIGLFLFFSGVRFFFSGERF